MWWALALVRYGEVLLKMTSLEFVFDQQNPVKPLPGRIAIRVDKPPAMIGSLHVPESARTQTERDLCLTGTVLAIGHGPFYEGSPKYKRYQGLLAEDVQVGDRVIFKALLKDLNRDCLLTVVTRVEGVIEIG